MLLMSPTMRHASSVFASRPVWHSEPSAWLGDCCATVAPSSPPNAPFEPFERSVISR
jgi:hypothetical protein